MDDELSVTDVKLFGSSHRGTLLPERDMAVLIGRVRKMEPSSARCRVEEITTPKPSPKKSPRPDTSIDVQTRPGVPRTGPLKPPAVPTRVSSIPLFASQPRASPPKSPPKPRVVTPMPSPGPSRASSRTSSKSSSSSFGSRPASPERSRPPSPVPQRQQPPRPTELPRTAAPPPPESVNWRKMFADADFKPEDFADIDVEKENASPFTRREKQEVLFQLIKTYPEESQGQWTMSVPLVELKYELKRREHFREEQAQVDAMKVGLKLLLHSIEAINQKVKSPLRLKGWARHATHDMAQYERPLRGLYYMYLRKRQMSPLAELGWIIVTSAAMWHIQSVMGGSPPSELDEVHDIPAPQAKKKQGLDLGSLAQLAKMFM